MPLQKFLLLVLLLAGIPPVAAQSFSRSETPASWSQKQMRHMLADRPVMKTYRVGEQILWVRQQDSIWQWVAEHYAGKTTQFWTAWHEAPPIETFEATHAYGKDKAYVYVKDLTAGQKGEHNAVFEKLWSGVVFELFNLENAEGFRDAYWAAYNGTTTRIEYVRTCARLEHLALGKSQQFHNDVWLPWCKANGLSSNASIWRQGYHPDFEVWLARYPADFRYPWQLYGEYFDQLRKDGEQKRSEEKSAAKK